MHSGGQDQTAMHSDAPLRNYAAARGALVPGLHIATHSITVALSGNLWEPST